ncbi:hypothetical protein GMST_29450 [Geomonas silvestris]|uniref:DUF1638 domain-containing protein n=1 Tax=Geomonas silvestris TaxID=2740184 RepID=A0A6V8MKS7_9BACT|nr:DUF1638 domain-containing protein [Geomonas silvestris]GFO60620.1 hypothetical protein GMST_29450 [Geomonas silvestris]
MRIGVIACDMIKLELEKVLAGFPEVEEIVWLESALHIYPERMKQTIIERVNELKGRVDLIFLGYGYCQSLKGIEAELAIPVILPQYDDCLALLMTPERYAEEKKREVGTWFMTPGWAEIGADLVIKELRLDRAIKFGKDPMALAKRLFTHYKRGLFIDTGVGETEHFRAQAEKFCRDFELTLEESSCNLTLLEAELRRCREYKP